MLEENAVREELGREEKNSASLRVSCFVCKQEVDQKDALQVEHPREKRVWVCKDHIK